MTAATGFGVIDAASGLGVLDAASGFQATDWLLIAVIVVLLGISGLLALAETSLTRMSRVKAKSLLDQRRRGARQLVRLVEHPEQFLNAVLLLVLICQLVSATLVGVLADRWIGALGVVVGTVFEVVVIFVIFEAVPKNWAVHNPDRAALFSAPLVAAVVRFPPIRAVSSVLIGLANLIIGRRRGEDESSNVTESELLAMADVAHAEDVIEHTERAFIHSIIDFGDAVVREVMVPRPDMVTLEADITVGRALEQALAGGHSRLPVYEDNVDDVIGIGYAKDLMRAEHDGHGADPVRAHIRPAHFVPETKRLTDLLREMQDRKFHMSVVVDEYGSTAGLVTLEDLIEELVGEIVDEYDVEEPTVERLPDGSVVVTGRMAVDDADDLLDAELPQGAWDTVGGLLLDLAGHVPAEGESVEVDGFRLVAQQVQGRRIGRVRIERTQPVGPSGDDERHGD
ncbi:MAG TPA: hemolysin family protein [Acidimicrobiales bacterium]|nr:hemolysin family protein [Acidimicrobiales bacterium]